MKFFIYILRSKSNNKIYIGHTSNLNKRLSQHNNPNRPFGGYTKLNKGPWEIVYKEVFITRNEAKKREKQLKSARGRKFIHEEVL